MSRVLLGLGTNLGNRQDNLRQALAGIAHFCQVTALSPIYETPPWGIADQPAFLNMCAAVETRLAPLPLLARLKQLELAMGRQHTVRWGPRIIDIDILFYDDVVLDGERLQLPHPRLAERPFVLVPLADIAPAQVHPLTGQRVDALRAAVDDAGVIRAGDLSLPDPLRDAAREEDHDRHAA